MVAEDEKKAAAAAAVAASRAALTAAAAAKTEVAANAAKTAAQEKQAGMAVRRCIQKLRTATPENFEELETELTTSLEDNIDKLGETWEKLQEEGDKAIEAARIRIEAIQEKRRQDEEKAARPKELMAELTVLVETLEADTLLLKESFQDAANLSSENKPMIEKIAEQLKTQLESFVEAVAEFTKENGAELKTTTAPLPQLATAYAGLTNKVVMKKSEAAQALAKAKVAVAGIAKKEALELIEAKKPELEAQLAEVTDWVATALTDIEAAETLVYPFSRGKRFTEADILKKSAEAEAAIATATTSVKAASEKSPSTSSLGDVDEALKAELEAWLKAESKKPRIQLCQFEARIKRCQQLVKTAKSEIQKARNESVVLEMKPKLLEDIKAAMDVATLEEPLKEIEKQVEPFSKVDKSKTVDELLEAGEKAAEAIVTYKESIAAARTALTPIDDSLDEDVKKQLKIFLASETKKPNLKLGQFEARLARAENLIKKYRNDAKKNKQKELIESLKPELLEKVKSGVGDSVTALEDMVKACEGDVEPFCRGCKITGAAELKSLADTAAASVELAKSSAVDARGDVCPIDESLEEDVKKELEAFIKPEIKRTHMQIGMLERRLRRCSQLVKSFKLDINKVEQDKIDKENALKAKRVLKVKGLLLALLRKHKEDKKLNTEQLFAAFSPKDGLIDEVAFQKFFKAAGADAEMPAEDRAGVFELYCKEGKNALNEEEFKRLASSYLKVVKATTLTDALSVADGKTLRKLNLGQVLLVLDAAKADGETGVTRVHVKTNVGGIEGWATITGNAGTAFLKECDAPNAPKAAPAKA